MSVPKLRFKGFEGDWTSSDFSKASVQIIDGDRGFNYPKSDDFYDDEFCLFLNAGNVTKQGFNFENTQFITKNKDSSLRKGKLERNDLVITTRGTVGNVAYFNDSVSFNNMRINSGMVIARCQKNVLADFINQFLKSDLFEKWLDKNAFGSAQPQLTVKLLNSISLNYPSKPEQTKIASFLSAVDEKISQLTQKHELLSQYKQGMMQKLFSQQIRFKADDGSEFGEWEELKFNFFIKERSQICSDSSIELCSLTIEKGITEKTDRYIRDFLVKDEKNAYKEVHFNDFVMNPMNLRFGAIAKSNIDRIVKISKYYNVFYIDEKIINLKYFVSFATSKPMIDFYNLMSTGSLVEKRRNHFKDFIQYEKKFPCLEEQTKIANFLSAIDQKIEVVAQQIEQAKTWKKGLLQQMFV